MIRLRQSARRLALVAVLGAALAAGAPAALAAVGFTSAGIHMVGLGTTALPAQAMTFGTSVAAGDARDPGAVQVSEVHVQRRPDAFTPELLRLSSTGKPVAALSFTVVQNRNGVLAQTMRVTLTNAFVQSVMIATSEDGSASEAVSFAYDAIKVESLEKGAMAPWSHAH